MNKFFSYKKWLNEKFAKDSDPISDMGIGSIPIIKKWMNDHNISKEEYQINKDDVDITFGDLYIYKEDVKDLPFKIGKIVGDYLIPDRYFIDTKHYKLPKKLIPKKVGGKVLINWDEWSTDFSKKTKTNLGIYLTQEETTQLWEKIKSGYKFKSIFYDADTDELEIDEWIDLHVNPLLKKGWKVFHHEDNFGQVEILLIKK